MGPASPVCVPAEHQAVWKVPVALCSPPNGLRLPSPKMPWNPRPFPEGPFSFPIFYREEPQAGSGRPADGTARARSATLQGSHSVATAELLAPLQDTVRCILKRKPPGRSGQPWSGSREQWSGREAPEMVKAQLRGKGQYSFLRPVCWTLQLPA